MDKEILEFTVIKRNVILKWKEMAIFSPRK